MIEDISDTGDGEAELIVQDAQADAERAETIAGVQRGIDQMKRGEGRPAAEAFAALQSRL